MNLTSAFSDLGDDDRLRAVGVLTAMRDAYADKGTRYGAAMAHALMLAAGAAADAGNAHEDTLKGICRATAGHRPLRAVRE